MSNYWDLYCRTCDVDCGFHWNHGDAQLLELWKHHAAFVEIGKLSNEVIHVDNKLPPGVRIDFTMTFYGPEHGGDEFPEFCAAHAGHDVLARSEYGYCSDACQELVPTGATTAFMCLRKAGHDGDHQPVKE